MRVMENKLQDIGRLLTVLRKNRGVSQERAALDSGVDRCYLSDLENGRRNPSLGVMIRLADYFCLELSQFFKLAENLHSPTNPADFLSDAGYDEAIIFQSPDFAAAFAGVSDCGRAVYSHSMMIACLVAEGMTADEAAEFIDYNTLRALPYMGPNAPIVVYD